MKKTLMAFSCLEELFQKAEEYEFTIIYMMSRLLAGKTAEVLEEAKSNPDEMLEARFFDSFHELHIFSREGEVKAVMIEDDGGQMSKEKSYPLSQNFKHLGRLMIVQYFNFDEDGQVYVEQTRCKGFIKGAADGKR